MKMPEKIEPVTVSYTHLPLPKHCHIFLQFRQWLAYLYLIHRPQELKSLCRYMARFLNLDKSFYCALDKDTYRLSLIHIQMCIRDSHDIVNVMECRIVDEDYRKILACTLGFARETGLPYYHRMRHIGYFRHLLVRKAVKTGEILIDIVTTTEHNFIEEAGGNQWVSQLPVSYTHLDVYKRQG